MDCNFPNSSSTMKYDKRWKPKPILSNRSSLIMVFLSCLAWLYIAGRLWQDSQNRLLLTDLLHKNKNQPRSLNVEDKLMVLGCKQMEKRIAELEMDLTLAKSQGYYSNRFPQSDGQKLLAVIGVYTTFGGRLRRNTLRGSWMSKSDAERKLQEKGVVIRFIIGRSANRGDSLDRNIDAENQSMKDFLILDEHEEVQEELPKKAKFFFSKAVEMWDADFYIKVDDNVNIDLDGLIKVLKQHQDQSGLYMGCMKSGDVISEEGRLWYEPQWWRFGSGKSYFLHAAGSVIVLSKKVAQYVSINSGSLQTYAHDDVSVGAWMLGLEAFYVDESRLCCGSSTLDKVCYLE